MLPPSASDRDALHAAADHFRLVRLLAVLAPYQPHAVSAVLEAEVREESAIRTHFAPHSPPAAFAAAAAAADALLIDVYARSGGEWTTRPWPNKESVGLQLLFETQRCNTSGGAVADTSAGGAACVRPGIGGFRAGWRSVADGKHVVGPPPAIALPFPEFSEFGPGVVAAGGAVLAALLLPANTAFDPSLRLAPGFRDSDVDLFLVARRGRMCWFVLMSHFFFLTSY